MLGIYSWCVVKDRDAWFERVDAISFLKLRSADGAVCPGRGKDIPGVMQWIR